jgi:hypothetical protein
MIYGRIGDKPLQLIETAQPLVAADYMIMI